VQTGYWGDKMSIGIAIDDYISNFGGAGFARQYRFIVYITFPGWANIASGTLMGGLGSGFSDMVNAGIGAVKGAIGTGVDALKVGDGTKGFSYLVKSSQLPSSEFEETNTHWQGQKYRIAGVQTFADWSVTFNVDSNAKILTKFYDWQRIIHDPQSNIYGKPTNYLADQEIHLLGLDGNPICVYKMYGAWPRSINTVELDYGSNDVATVEIAFAYQYHTVTEKPQGTLKTLLKKTGRSIIGGL
jgi:hypothetical protein